MTQIWHSVAALFCAVMVAGSSGAAADPPPPIHVIDGDTVEQAGVRWRLAGIDAPEIHRARCPEERRRAVFGAARLITLIETHGGRLEPTSGHGGASRRDKHGRTLGRLVLGDGRSWGDIAIAEGHAVAWDGRGKQPTWCRAPGS